MTSLLPLVLAALTIISPAGPSTGDAYAVTRAIANVAEHDAMPTGWSREKVAVVLTAAAWRESHMAMHVHGDCKKDPAGRRIFETCKAHCAMQAWGPAWLADDPVSCVRAGLAVIRISVDKNLCPDEPLAPYCGGCRSQAARAIAREWSRQSDRLLTEALEALRVEQERDRDLRR